MITLPLILIVSAVLVVLIVVVSIAAVTGDGRDSNLPGVCFGAVVIVFILGVAFAAGYEHAKAIHEGRTIRIGDPERFKEPRP